jgi:formylglycine-generating enzyme required for sulfatase activity
MNVRSFQQGASLYGVFNMSGNVFEWVADWFDKTYYSYGDTINPAGPLAAELKSVRGGSFSGGQIKDKWTDWEYFGTWDGYDWYISYLKGINAKWEFNYQSTTRFSWKPDGSNTIIGFRCALPSP